MTKQNNTAKKEYVLIISAGRTNIKTVAKTIDDEYSIREIDSIRKFYDTITGKKEEEDFGKDNPFEQVEIMSKADLQKTITLSAAKGKKPEMISLTDLDKNKDKNLVPYKVNNKFILVPVKLDDIISALKNNPDHPYGNCLGGVVFGTRRKDSKETKDSFTHNEPYLVSRLLTHWLNKVFDLPFKSVEFLTGDERTEKAAKFGEFYANIQQDLPILRDAANRIDGAIRELQTAHPHATAILSLGGGMPEYKAVIEASVRMHFGANKIIHNTESETHQERQFQIEESEQRISVLNSLNVRSQCLHAIHRGDFVGAYAIAESFVNQAGETANASLYDRRQPATPITWKAADDQVKAAGSIDLIEDWVVLLHNYARAFSGYELDFLQTGADREKLKSQNSVLFTLFDHTETQPDFPACLLPALEVEAYLREHNYKQALLTTYTFLENVKKDILHHFIPKYNPHKDELTGELTGEIPEALQALFKEREDPHDTSKTIKHAVIMGKKNNDLLFNENTPPSSKEILCPGNDELDELRAALKAFKELRNKLSHSRASTQDLTDLLKHAEDAKIWVKTADQGYSLLANERVIKVINELCENDFSAKKFKTADKECENWQQVFNTMLAELETQIKDSTLKTKPFEITS